MEGIEECRSQIRDSFLYDIAVGLCGANSALPIVYKQRVLTVNGKASLKKRMCFNRGEIRKWGSRNRILGKIRLAIRDNAL